MSRIGPWVLAGMMSSLWALAAAAEPKSPASADSTSTSADDERAFEADAERYERLRQFTLKLVREREERVFEEAAEQYSRLSKLTRTLAAAAAVAQERAFDAEVELYLKKRALTRELSTGRSPQAAASSTPASPAW